MLNLVEKYKKALKERDRFLVQSIKLFKESLQEPLYSTKFSSKTALSKNRVEARKHPLHSRAYAMWSEEENKELLLGFKKKQSLSSLAKKHQRSQGAVRSQLQTRYGISCYE